MRIASSLLLLGVVGLVACSSDDTVQSSDDLVANILANTAKVEADRLVFPKTSINAAMRERIAKYATAVAENRGDKVENVILVSDRQTNATDASGKIIPDVDNPYGYLRRALSVRDEGDKTIITTEDATLEDVINELDDQQVFAVGASDPTLPGGMVTPQIAKRLNFTIPVIHLQDRDLLRTAGVTVRVRNAEMTINTVIDLGANISAFRLNHAHAIIDADIQSNIAIEVGGIQSVNVTPRMSLFTGSWPVGSIGPVPVTLQLKAILGCDVQADGSFSASGGLTAPVHAHAGISYERGRGTSPSFEPPTFNPSIASPSVNAVGTAGARCYVRPELSLLLAGLAGPLVAPVGYARVEASAVAPQPVKAALYGGVSVYVGGKLSVLGRDVGKVDAEVFNFEKELWRR